MCKHYFCKIELPPILNLQLIRDHLMSKDYKEKKFHNTSNKYLNINNFAEMVIKLYLI